MEAELSRSEQSTLLSLARLAIADSLHRDGRLDRALTDLVVTPGLEQPRGVFVTLKSPAPEPVPSVQSVLRGCIGILESAQPVYRSVIDTAPKAAFDDPRFSPLTREELDRVVLSISVLTPPRSVDDWHDIVIGRDGVQLVRGASRSVFLPQVAVEQGWNLRTLLEHLSVKAGLNRDAWREADLFSFRAQSFAEIQPGG